MSALLIPSRRPVTLFTSLPSVSAITPRKIAKSVAFEVILAAKKSLILTMKAPSPRTYAREDIEKLLGLRVFLDLYVRVKENWRDSDFNISNFGYRDEN